MSTVLLPDLLDRFHRVRRFSDRLCEPLEVEDYIIQSMPDVSPTRWHLAHTTWFFETFVLKPAVPGYVAVCEDFEFLFNSYYNTVGEQFPRPQRGLLSRPTVREVRRYRQEIDERMTELLEQLDADENHDLLEVVELGLHHEQQHQELMLTDIKHVFSCNPLFPVYQERTLTDSVASSDPGWHSLSGGIVEIGHNGAGFAYDNELPRHESLIQDVEIATQLVTNGEFLAFIEDDGYQRPELWLSLGWSTVLEHAWRAPLYWFKRNDQWMQFTLSGLRPVDETEPVCHVSYFEADAYARWRGMRLPTEAEWEWLATDRSIAGNFADEEIFHPVPTANTGDATQLFGDVWEWTGSAYHPYPGYRPPPGAIGEYNGKFMCNQYVLRGGSCATSRDHIRVTYRNFFPPEARWQFSGLRLARDLRLGK